MTATGIRPGVFLISWQEAGKTAVVDAGDFGKEIVCANITRPEGTFLQMKGTLKCLQ